MRLSLLSGRKKLGIENNDPDQEAYPQESRKLELLSAMDIFQDLPEEEVAELLDATPMLTAVKGTVFYGEEDGPEVLFLLKSGRVKLERVSPDGRKLTLAIVEKGTFFGEMSLVDQSLVGTHAVAIEDAVICALSRHDLQSLMLEHPTVALRLIDVLARRLQGARDGLQEMVFNDVTGRVAGLLVRLADEETGVVAGYSHQDLAAMVGCLRESFTAVLDRFRKTSAVEIGRKRITIVDRSQLEQAISQRAGSGS
jgi:CRP-like cAMP-binding protein